MDDDSLVSLGIGVLLFILVAVGSYRIVSTIFDINDRLSAIEKRLSLIAPIDKDAPND